MTYLGVVEEAYKGLYRFDTITIRDSIGNTLEGCRFYNASEKKKALEEMGLESKDIQDGGVLIKAVRKDARFIPEDAPYLVIKSGVYMGVYFFFSKETRDTIAKAFGGLSVIPDSRTTAIKAYAAPRIQIKDGGILMSGECREWRKTHHHLTVGRVNYAYDESVLKAEEERKAEEVRKEEEARKVEEARKEEEARKVEDTVKAEMEHNAEDARKEVHEEICENEVDEAEEVVEVSEETNVSDERYNADDLDDTQKYGVVKEIIDSLASENDILCISMSNGSDYFVTTQGLFYVPEDFDFNTVMNVDDDGNKSVDSEKISVQVESGILTAIGLTTVEYKGNFLILNNADDEYSPNPKTNDENHTYFEHGIKRIVLNISQIVSIKAVEDFEGMVWKKISENTSNCKEVSEFIHEYYTVW